MQTLRVYSVILCGVQGALISKSKGSVLSRSGILLLSEQTTCIPLWQSAGRFRQSVQAKAWNGWYFFDLLCQSNRREQWHVVSRKSAWKDSNLKKLKNGNLEEVCWDFYNQHLRISCVFLFSPNCINKDWVIMHRAFDYLCYWSILIGN